MHRLPLRYSELYSAKKMIIERLQEIDSIIDKHKYWWQPSIPKDEMYQLENEKMKLLQGMNDLYDTFFDNLNLIKTQTEPDYPIL